MTAPLKETCIRALSCQFTTRPICTALTACATNPAGCCGGAARRLTNPPYRPSRNCRPFCGRSPLHLVLLSTRDPRIEGRICREISFRRPQQCFALLASPRSATGHFHTPAVLVFRCLIVIFIFWGAIRLVCTDFLVEASDDLHLPRRRWLHARACGLAHWRCPAARRLLHGADCPLREQSRSRLRCAHLRGHVLWRSLRRAVVQTVHLPTFSCSFPLAGREILSSTIARAVLSPVSSALAHRADRCGCRPFGGRAYPLGMTRP